MTPIRDHKQIRQWAAKQNAIPAEIRPRTFNSEPAVLTFILGSPNKAQPEIFPVSWESFFAQFDLLGLALAYDDNTPRFEIVQFNQSEGANVPRDLWA